MFELFVFSDNEDARSAGVCGVRGFCTGTDRRRCALGRLSATS